jgi:hypothetical protein
MRFHLGDRVDELDFPSLIESMPDATFASPRRSTVFLLDFWRNPQPRLAAFAQALGLSNIRDPELYFEYPVKVREGRGKASFTDLMIKGLDIAFGVEAKHRESEYESCADWLGESGSDSNRDKVLKGWISYIKDNSGTELTQENIASLPYQLVHRTASLFSVQAAQRYLVYQVFEDAGTKAKVPKIEDFRDTLGRPSGFHVVVMRCRCEPTPGFRAVIDTWENSRPKKSVCNEVRQALLAGPVFDFGQPSTVMDTDLARE